MFAQRLDKKMPQFDGLAAGQTALAKMPIGHKYHILYLHYSGVTLEQMREIRVIANTKTIHRYSAVERNAINMFDGLEDAAESGVLMIPFDRWDLITRAGEEETAINTGQPDPQTGQMITALNVEIDLDDGDYTPRIDIYAIYSASEPGRGPGTILHIDKTTRAAAGAGDFEVSDLPFNRPTALALNRAFLRPSANDVSKITVERSLYKVFERPKALNERIQRDHGLKPQPGMAAVDFTEQGYGGNALDLRGASDFRYRLNMTGAATITFISEYMGVLGE